MLRLDKVIKPWKESASLNDHINLYGFWNETAFLTKSGDLGMVLSVPGVDYESLDRSQQEYAVKRLEAALKAFGPGFHVYQYLFKSNRPDIPFATYDDLKVIVEPADRSAIVAASGPPQFVPAAQLEQSRQQLPGERLPAAFRELFGSPRAAAERFSSAKLGEVTNFIDYRGIAPNKTTTGVRLVTARNIKRGYFEIEPQEFIPAEEYSSWMTRGMPRPGDVLFTTEGHTLGSAAKLPSFNKVALAQRLIALQPKGQITSDYLLYVILHPSFQDQVVKHSTGSAARGISSKNLADLTIPLPPLPLQQKFANLVRRVEHLRSLQQESSRQAEHLFQTLLHNAFVGEPVEFDHVHAARPLD